MRLKRKVIRNTSWSWEEISLLRKQEISRRSEMIQRGHLSLTMSRPTNNVYSLSAYSVMFSRQTTWATKDSKPASRFLNDCPSTLPRILIPTQFNLSSIIQVTSRPYTLSQLPSSFLAFESSSSNLFWYQRWNRFRFSSSAVRTIVRIPTPLRFPLSIDLLKVSSIISN